LACTPSYALYLSEALRESVRGGGSAAAGGLLRREPWSENMRREIQDKLKILACVIYGLTEIIGPGVAFECEKQDGLHAMKISSSPRS
jgi:phenylacetate-CoA ligase